MSSNFPLNFMDVLQIYVVTDDVPDMMTRIHVVPRKEKIHLRASRSIIIWYYQLSM
jgi:hypothetical protein